MHAILKIRSLLTKTETFLTIDSLIRIKNIITNSHNLNLRQHNVKPAGYNKQYMDTSRIEVKLYQLVDQRNDRRITPRHFCDVFLDRIHPFADENDSTCKILINDKIENFYKIYKVTWFIFCSDSFPKRCRTLHQEMLFFQNYAEFFIWSKKNVFMLLYTLFVDQVSCIINNRNILTDRRWRCYYVMGQRICYRYGGKL